jgi:hypothetical protein
MRVISGRQKRPPLALNQKDIDDLLSENRFQNFQATGTPIAPALMLCVYCASYIPSEYHGMDSLAFSGDRHRPDTSSQLTIK